MIFEKRAAVLRAKMRYEIKKRQIEAHRSDKNRKCVCNECAVCRGTLRRRGESDEILKSLRNEYREIRRELGL